MFVQDRDWDLSSISGDELENPVYISSSEGDTEASVDEPYAGASIQAEVTIYYINP